MTDRRRQWLGAAILIALTTIAYGPALRGGFILDDDKLLTDNPLVRSSDGLWRIWGTTEAPDYWPMTNTSFWLEWRLWGWNSTGYHVTNLLLHLVSAFLIWAVLNKLAIPGGFLAALLFAVHPVNVESVAWIAQRKNTLAIVFFLLSLWCYLNDEDRREPASAKSSTWKQSFGAGLWYWLSLLMFLLAMLSKGSVAILPLVLLMLVWWQRRRMAASDIVRSVPFFLVAIVLTRVNLWFQTHGIDFSFRDVSFSQRLAGAGGVLWFYLSKALLPIRLIFVYPQWEVDVRQWLWWLPLVGVVVLTSVLWWRRNSPSSKPVRAILLAWGCFAASLIPVLGFTDVGFMQYSLVADHYQHLALVAVAALVAAAWRWWRDAATGTRRTLINFCAVIIVGELAVLTWQQCHIYTDSITVYRATLAENPTAWMIHNNLGQQLYEQHQLDEARKHYEQALRLHPVYPDALNNLGIILADEGHLPEAMALYQKALQIRPDHVNAHNSLGNAYSALGRLPEAIEQYQLAIQSRPSHAIAHYNLGNAYLRSNRMPEALQQYQLCVQFDPQFIRGYINVAATNAELGRPAEAIVAAQTALTLARVQGEQSLAKTIEAWLTAYRAEHTGANGNGPVVHPPINSLSPTST